MSLIAMLDASKPEEEINIGRVIVQSRTRTAKRTNRLLTILETGQWDSMQKQQNRKEYR